MDDTANPDVAARVQSSFGEHSRAVGKVIRAGRTLTVCGAEVEARSGEKHTVIAIMQGTMMAVANASLVD